MPPHKTSIFQICISGYVHPEDRDIFAVSHSTNGRPCESDREGREEDRREKFAGISKKEVICSLRKEVIQPHLPVRLPCYDFTPLTRHTFGTAPLMQVRLATSGTPNSGGVTGGVYKARERIHRAMLMRDY